MRLGKIGTIVLILFVFAMVVSAVSAEENSLVGAADGKLMVENDNHAVLLDNSNDDGDLELSATDSQETLNAASVGNYTDLKSLIDANPDGTISLDKDYAYSSSDKISYIIIPHSITINGNGHKISGEKKTMSIYIPETVSHVTLNNITFVNGKGNSMLWIDGDDCLVDNCTFEDNVAPDYAPVYIEGANNIVSNSRFLRNTAYYGGAAFIWGHDNVFENCYFEANSANNYYGGAFCLYGYNNSVKSSTFKGNRNAYQGGAIYMAGNDNTVDGCRFENGVASYGGAIANVGKSNVITNSTFVNNRANSYGGAIYVTSPNLVIEDSEFSTNTASRGGAIYISTDGVKVRNSSFYNNRATSNSGAIGIYGMHNLVENSTFEYNTASNEGGAVGVEYHARYYSLMLNNTIRNSTFSHNEAVNYGGGIRFASQGNYIDDCEFYYNKANIGAGVSFNSNRNEIDNSKFEHNTATTRGGAININSDYSIVNNTNMSYNTAYEGGAVYFDYWAYYSVVNNSVFTDNKATHDGGAIYWYASDGTVDNSVFYNNMVDAAWKDQGRGGAIYSIGQNALVSNSKFIKNEAKNYGSYSDAGAINFECNNAQVINCEFEDNIADSSGGAIRWIGDNGKVYNSSFTGNNVSSEGGAIYYGGSNVLIKDSSFTNNNVFYYIGGALALDTNGVIDNSTFADNFAYKGGAVHWIDTGDCLINNSYFYNNRGVYAGGAVACDYFYSNADKSIQNTRFENNTCVNYGGAVAALQTDLINCTFTENSADMGGAIHTYDSLIKDSVFADNVAKYGSDIYHSGSELVNVDVAPENIVYIPSELAEVVRYNIGNSTRLMNNSYIGMCFERHSFMPKYGAYDGSLLGLVNVLTGESIVEYLKLLVYESFNSMEDVYAHEGDNYRLYPEGWEGNPISEDESKWVSIPRTDYYSRVVHIFSDCDFRKSAHPVVKRILELYDQGVRINQDHEKMVDGTLIRYHFSTLMSPASQSLFLFLIIPEPRLEKTYLNTTGTVYANDTVAFNITVNNTGDMPLVNLSVLEIYNPDELEYVGHSDNTTWIKNGNTFTYYQDPEAGDIVVYNVCLENTGNCNLEDIVIANIYDPTQLEFVKCGNADLIKIGETFMYHPEIKANEKVTLNIFFKMLYKDIDLTDLTPAITDYKLSQDNYYGYNNAVISIDRQYGGRYSPLNVGETATFTIWFKTLTTGTLKNNVSLKSIGLKEEITASNKTEVSLPNMTVEKIALNTTGTVYVGDVIAFDIVVRNTGDCDLGDVTVTEIFDASELEYVKHSDDSLWIKSGNVFAYKNVLGAGDVSAFTIWFKTLTNGTLVNNVTAKSNVTEETPSNNTTTVYLPDMTVQKIALNNTGAVYVGDVIAFDIVVRNTGDCDLGDVTVKEIFNSAELEYLKHSDDALWIKTGNDFVYQNVLGVGDVSAFTIWFTTLTNGTLVNNVTAKSNVTDETPSNNTTVVYNPDMTVQKIALNNTGAVYVGDVIAFDIVVRNTGDCDLGDVTVKEIFDVSELDYVRHSDDSVWIKTGNEFVYQNVLGVGDVSAFTVWFKTLTNGTLVNNVTAKSNVTDETPSNNTTVVYKPDMTVQKIALNNTGAVYVGDVIAFDIVVRNTGDCDLGNVIVTEIFDVSELSYVRHSDDALWIMDTNTFAYQNVLGVGDVASFTIWFKTLTNGTLVNNVTARSNVTDETPSNNTTVVYKPDMTVEKIALNNTVTTYVGDVIAFTIVVKNTGDCDLGDVTVDEIFDASELSYVRHSDDSVWIKTGNVFAYNGVLGVGDASAFTVWFKTLTNGTLVNNVTAKSNVTEETPANNTTVVYLPGMTVEKIALNNTVTSYVGDVIAFTIVVRNTGDCELGDVTVSEIFDANELDYVRHSDDAAWIKTGNVFAYQNVLGVGDVSSFTVWFKTLTNGTLVNNVIAKSNVTDETPANNTTDVYLPGMSVEKIALNNTVTSYVGDVIAFTIVVRNTGDCDLGDVTVSEIFDANELTYVRHSDDALWIKSGNVFAYQDVLASGDESSFTIWFKTLTNGTIVNNVIAKSNVTDETPANNTTDVYLPGMTVEKIALNNTVTAYVGDVIAFTIVVKNTGDCDLGDVTVSEIFDAAELEYVRHSDDALWIKQDNIFTYQGVLGVGDVSAFTVWFKTLTNGTIVNNVIAKSNVTDETPANNTTDVYLPGMSVEKIALNNTVTAYVGDVIAFTIVVKNTGDCDLGDVTVSEIFDANELTYIRHSDDAAWIKQDNIFVYQGILASGEVSAFTVWFEALTNGTIVNNVIAKSNVTDETPANNTTVVYLPGMSVEKIALNNTVTAYVGDVIAFTIVVKNTGDCDLGDVTVSEIFDANELAYVRHIDDALWIKQDNEFAYQGVLAAGEVSAFTVWFEALTNTTIVNNVVAKSNVTDETPANNTTVVYLPGMTVEKIALNKAAYVGDVIAFAIVVRNTGDCDLGDVTVSEIFDANELAYVRHSDDALWIKQDNIFAYQGVLAAGEVSAFTVWFNTLTNGTIVNNVVAKSNVTDETPANNTTVVYLPGMTVEKIALNKVVYMGDLTSFTIAVYNTGDCDLADVTVFEKSYEGLTFDSYANGTGNWLRFDDTYVLDGVLAKGDSASFIVTFKTAVKGNFTNVVVASSNVTENETANDTTEVLPLCDVEVIKLVDSAVHYLDESIVWTIVVKNNGPDDAADVMLSDVLPDTLALIDSTATKGEYSNSIWTIGTLKPGEIQSLKLVTMATESGINITNVAVANTTTTETNESNNVGENKTEILQKVALTIEKTASVQDPDSGDVITWIITVTNYGPDAAENVVITDELPDGLVLVDSQTTWTFDSIAPGESVSVTIKTLVNATGLIVNVATVTTTSNNTGENRTDETINVPEVLKIDIEVGGDDTPKYGDTVNWTAVIGYNGYEAEDNVTIVYDEPIGATYFEPVKHEDKEEPTHSINVTPIGVPEVEEPVNATVDVEYPLEAPEDTNDTNETETEDVPPETDEVEETPDVPTDEPSIVEKKDSDSNKTQSEPKHSDVDVNERQTANPFAVLLLALVSIVALQINRKRK